MSDWHRSILAASQGSEHRHRNFRRQLSEYGTFQNLSRGKIDIWSKLSSENVSYVSVSRSSVDSSPCSSIGRHYSSPPPPPGHAGSHSPAENIYGAPPSRDQVYGAPPRDPVYEVPLNSLPRFLQSPSASRTNYTSSPSRLYERRTSVPRLCDQNVRGNSSPYGFTPVPLKLNQTMFL